jgi:hypothetical protein
MRATKTILMGLEPRRRRSVPLSKKKGEAANNENGVIRRRV